eukprot:TRINITY_DN26890_c0_g1_i1.p1 TRINITY_DN26890_c0_g1~~TRINITY_DN26890_c0_g1_i1.p1  ORF type:complete len:182 (-),score=9.61 TRINITY_DN26890_c0_g1_i1:23-568(-)
MATISEFFQRQKFDQIGRQAVQIQMITITSIIVKLILYVIMFMMVPSIMIGVALALYVLLEFLQDFLAFYGSLKRLITPLEVLLVMQMLYWTILITGLGCFFFVMVMSSFFFFQGGGGFDRRRSSHNDRYDMEIIMIFACLALYLVSIGIKVVQFINVWRIRTELQREKQLRDQSEQILGA